MTYQCLLRTNACVRACAQAAEALEAAGKRAEREREVLKAEKHVWTVAHSGVQAELANLSAALERERQAHEDTRGAWKKARDGAQRAKAEAEGLRARLDVKGDERLLQAAQEELGNARAEVRDLTDAVGKQAVVTCCSVVHACAFLFSPD